ncbi:MAG: carbon-nitrogen hydrolase family protein [Firmicutes bacterium]|nr:carbon-nitrogen hydrolase family protein [Bacillota bacterium]
MMARYVTISALGPKPYLLDLDLDYNTAVERMIDHWNRQFSDVLPDKPDIIITHEACDRSPLYSMERRLEYYKVRGNRVRDFMREIASVHNCYIAYSAAREMADGTWRNSTQIIDRNGNIAGIYNKNHVVITETTKGGILCGKDAPIIECDFGRIACAICFDLNFEELRQKYEKEKPDLIVFSSMYHGGFMQNYWAYSCRAHFAGAVSGLPCTIISPVGELIASSTNYFSFVTATVNLDCKVIHLDWNWDKLRAAKQKYGSKFKISDPGFLGAVLISSESDDFSIDDIVKEFEFELLDDYFARSLAHRHSNIEP